MANSARQVSTGRAEVTQRGDGEMWKTIGLYTGGIGALITFVSVYIAAVASVGWVFGIALGWIPAWLAAMVAFVALRYLWWILVLALLYALFRLNV